MADKVNQIAPGAFIIHSEQLQLAQIFDLPFSCHSLADVLEMSGAESLVREIFVTVGATASFDDLIDRVLSHDFRKTAGALKFNKINIQCGKSYPKYQELIESIDGLEADLKITAFDFNELGLGQEMRGTTLGHGRLPGVVISHAGSGSILDAMRLGCHIIVVPNETLLDNHQVELADELENQGYVTKGNIRNLSDALRKCNEHAVTEPIYTWPKDSAGRTADIIDETIIREQAIKGHLD